MHLLGGRGGAQLHSHWFSTSLTPGRRGLAPPGLFLLVWAVPSLPPAPGPAQWHRCHWRSCVLTHLPPERQTDQQTPEGRTAQVDMVAKEAEQAADKHQTRLASGSEGCTVLPPPPPPAGPTGPQQEFEVGRSFHLIHCLLSLQS